MYDELLPVPRPDSGICGTRHSTMPWCGRVRRPQPTVCALAPAYEPWVDCLWLDIALSASQSGTI